MQQPVELFFSYAHEDEDLMDDVRRQLTLYDRQNLIVKWHDRLIPPGEEWAGQIDQRLREARIILLFISPHFIESRYCYDVEMAEALRRHEAGQAVVIPIILRPCPWHDSPVGRLQVLPRDGRPLTLWQNRDEVCFEIAKSVISVVRRLAGIDPSGVQTRQRVAELHEEVGRLLAQGDSAEMKADQNPSTRQGEIASGRSKEQNVRKARRPKVKWLIIRLISVSVLILGAAVLLTELDVLLASQLWVVRPLLALYVGCEVLLFGYLWTKRSD